MGKMSMLFGQPIRQLGYCVPDVQEAARRHSALFGSGPFFVRAGMRVPCDHRGVRTLCELTIAIGQWGSQMVEFVQQDNSGPSVFHDVYPAGSGRSGLHHVAIIVENLSQAVATVQAAGYPPVGFFHPEEGYEVVFADATTGLGHMIEMYQSIQPVIDVYNFIAAAAVGFDGREPLRPLV